MAVISFARVWCAAELLAEPASQQLGRERMAATVPMLEPTAATLDTVEIDVIFFRDALHGLDQREEGDPSPRGEVGEVTRSG